MNNTIFKPTTEYRELLILNAISNKPNVTQRELAIITELSIGSINLVLDEYTNSGFIEKQEINSKSYKYILSKSGKKELKYLSMNLIKATLDMYNNAKQECIRYLKELVSDGFKKIILYGAGKVCELILHVIYENKDLGINVIGIADDDLNKVGEELYGFDVMGLDQIGLNKFDCVLITSYDHLDKMKENICEYNVSPRKIKSYFE